MALSRLWAGVALIVTGLVLTGGRAAVAASHARQTKTDAAQSKAGQPDLAETSIPVFPGLPAATCSATGGCQPLPQLAQAMLQLLNQDRAAPANDPETKGDAHPLKWDPRLAAVALAHSEDMIAERYFSHVDPSGDSPAERLYKAGVRWVSMGENIAINYTAPLAEAAFMNEPRFQINHRANILNPKFNYVGIGVVRAPDGMLYVTQDFASEP